MRCIRTWEEAGEVGRGEGLGVRVNTGTCTHNIKCSAVIRY